MNRIRLNKIAVHLVPVINEVLEDVRPLATAKTIEIEAILYSTAPVQESQLTLQSEAEEPSVTQDLPSLTGLRVLIVDDDQDSLDLTAFVLEQCEATVKTANSVDSALAVFSQFNPNVLVSNIGIPEQDGYFLIQQIRQTEVNPSNAIAAVALTAFAKEEDQQQALSAGFQCHLTKPVNPYELVATIASLVQ